MEIQVNTDDLIKTAFHALQTNVLWRDTDFLRSHGVAYYYLDWRLYAIRFGQFSTARYIVVQGRHPYDAYCRAVEG